MYEGPEFRHYHSFITVAEECHFGRAAKRLHLTQPALTTHIQQLEEWVGEKLFQRLNHGAELTETGRNFLPFARSMLHAQGSARKAVSRKHSDDLLPMRFGYSPFANHGLIDQLVSTYKEIVPEGQSSTSSDCTAQLISMIRDGRLDAAIVTLPVAEPDLNQHVIARERLLICLRADDPLAAGPDIPKEDVTERLKIMFNRPYHPPFYDKLMTAFRDAGMTGRPSHRFSAPSEMQFLVSRRNCFGLIREGMPLEPQLVARPIRDFEMWIETAFVFKVEEKKAALSILGYRMSQLLTHNVPTQAKKPVGSVQRKTASEAERRA
jgi:DNA-binding transcriptional LysR family regulator